MTVQPVHDPRPLFARALDQTERQVAAVRPNELGNGTPCADYDVRALLGHLVSVLYKITTVATGGDAREVPAVIEGIDDDGWAGAFTQARGEAQRVWSDDALLDRPVTLPWATLPGRVALDAYTHEFTAHSWDLAHATDRLHDLDDDLAAKAIEAFQTFAPPEERGDRAPFGPIVSVPDDADPYPRLAAFLGRRP